MSIVTGYFIAAAGIENHLYTLKLAERNILRIVMRYLTKYPQTIKLMHRNLCCLGYHVVFEHRKHIFVYCSRQQILLTCTANKITRQSVGWVRNFNLRFTLYKGKLALDSGYECYTLSSGTIDVRKKHFAIVDINPALVTVNGLIFALRENHEAKRMANYIYTLLRGPGIYTTVCLYQIDKLTSGLNRPIIEFPISDNVTIRLRVRNSKLYFMSCYDIVVVDPVMCQVLMRWSCIVDTSMPSAVFAPWNSIDDLCIKKTGEILVIDRDSNIWEIKY